MVGYIAAPAEESYAQAFIREVNNDLNDVKHSFIRIGFRLVEANKYKYFKELGYESIVELAEAEFGFQKTMTYGLMRVYELAHDKQAPMCIADRYDKFTHSQLLVLTGLKYDGEAVYNIIRPTDSVEKLKKFVRNWNEEYRYGCGYHPGLKTVDEYIEAYERKHNNVQKLNTTQQLPGQMDLDELSEDKEDSAYAENDEISEYLPDDELIIYCLKEGPRIEHGKATIYDKWRQQATMEEFKQYVKEQYGNGCYGGGDKYYKEVTFSPSEGLIIKRRIGGIIHIKSWGAVAGRISRLCESGEYVTEKELADYEAWKAKVLANEIVPKESDFSAYAENNESEDFQEKAQRDGIKVAIEQSPQFKRAGLRSSILLSELKELVNWNYIALTNITEAAKQITDCVCSMPDSFGKGMPYQDRLRQWVQIWLNQPIE